MARINGARICEVAWEQVCRPKEEGGLGFRNILVMNQALMLKHLWKLIQNDRKSIWADWIIKYRLHKKTLWTFHCSTGSWGWKKMIKLSPFFQRGLQYKVDGLYFQLWQDIWHERGPLCVSYPQGPNVTGLPIDTLLSRVMRHGQWNWPTSTDPDFNELATQLPPIYANRPDQIVWRTRSGRFSTQFAYSLFQPNRTKVEWHTLLHDRYKIPKHTFILWLAILEKLSTMDKFWISHGDIGCVLCDGQFVESHDHLFFKCQYSKRCLSLVQRQVRFQWPIYDWQQGISWANKRWRSHHLFNTASRALLAALAYHLWMERNNRKFNNTGTTADSIAHQIIEDIRLRIMIDECNPNLQTIALSRIWKIAWPNAHLAHSL
ncbi:UNVERIFIED_CONTAM: putative mitochondrial protein [Sesamum angustifolium]|uniref:Mitochondrial protein n=1 Tax=Sesamum angustifolium TaxID=2727405 RepID=A0AAW2IZV3_9LAMI